MSFYQSTRFIQVITPLVLRLWDIASEEKIQVVSHVQRVQRFRFFVHYIYPLFSMLFLPSAIVLLHTARIQVLTRNLREEGDGRNIIKKDKNPTIFFLAYRNALGSENR